MKCHEEEPKKTEPASKLIDARIEDLGDWRGEMLALIRAAIALNSAKAKARR